MSITASSLLFKSVVATGNSRQDLTHEIEFHGSVKQRNTTAWATQLPEVQTVQCTETMRFGEPLVSHLKSIAPILDSLTTATKRSAYWLPVWIKKPTLATTARQADRFVALSGRSGQTQFSRYTRCTLMLQSSVAPKPRIGHHTSTKAITSCSLATVLETTAITSCCVRRLGP